MSQAPSHVPSGCRDSEGKGRPVGKGVCVDGPEGALVGAAFGDGSGAAEGGPRHPRPPELAGSWLCWWPSGPGWGHPWGEVTGVQGQLAVRFREWVGGHGSRERVHPREGPTWGWRGGSRWGPRGGADGEAWGVCPMAQDAAPPAADTAQLGPLSSGLLCRLPASFWVPVVSPGTPGCPRQVAPGGGWMGDAEALGS